MSHERMLAVFHDIFDPSLPQLAPSDDRSTRRALELLYGRELELAREGLRILDLGCGNGAQTLRLAAQLPAIVTAVDNHQPYLDELDRRAEQCGLNGRIDTLCADMTRLDWVDERYHLVWAEGSAYNHGIAKALRAWRDLLVPGGALGFTELVWLREDAPAECRSFFDNGYPEMTDASSHVRTLAGLGYELVGRFTLPESAWRENYYAPLRARLQSYEAPLRDEVAAEVLEMLEREIATYESFADYYGYEFFVARV